MKRIAVLLVAIALAYPSARADTTVPFAKATTTLSVSGILSRGSIVLFKSQLKRTAGVASYELNEARGKIEIVYDAGTTDAGTIAESLLRAGFTVRLSPWEPVDASFDGCSNGSCGIRTPNAQVSPQPNAAPGQRVYCPVSGVVLLVTASTRSVDVNGRTMRVCCEGCARYFKANRDRVLALRGLNPTS